MDDQESQKQGPFVLFAVLCQRAQQDQYGALSIINVLEQLVVGPGERAEQAPETMPSFRFQANLAVCLASGWRTGTGSLSILPVRPSGETLDAVDQIVEFRGGDHRVTMISNVSMDMTEEGIYWFEVRVDGQRLTQIPLRVSYERASEQPWTLLELNA